MGVSEGREEEVVWAEAPPFRRENGEEVKDYPLAQILDTEGELAVEVVKDIAELRIERSST